MPAFARSRRWYLLLGGLMVGAVLVVAIFAEELTSLSPYYMDAKPTIVQGVPPFPQGPDHPLGTDQWGRDVWSRVAFGARWSLLFAALIMAARMLVAVPAAILAAFGPRLAGWLLGRLYVYTSAIPPLLIYLLLLSVPGLRNVGLWPSVTVTVILLTLVEWPRIAVGLKGRLEELAAEPYVEGAVAAGATPWRIFWVHLMPHLWPTLLHVTVSEMGRGLLNIAQLGVFGIFVGGGLQELMEDARGQQFLVRTTGVPEWGTLLADARRFVYWAPWIPVAPAFAFFVGVVGFNLFAQGLEGVVFSAARWKEATTGRLSPRWRWAAAALPLAFVLWFYGGLPWGREAAIAALAKQQAIALTDRSTDAYMRLVRGTEQYRSEQSRWAADLAEGGHGLVAITPGQIKLFGNRATALWQITLGYRDRPPVSISREVELVRRWGRWYEEGEALSTLRGRHTDIQAFYDPTDPSRQAIDKRFAVHFLATAADRAYERVAPYFPDGSERPVIKLYASHEAFQKAIAGEPGAGPEATVWYTPGQSIRVSPNFLHGLNRRDAERHLSYQVLKYLSVTRLKVAGAAPMPLLMGVYERGDEPYRMDFDWLAGAPLFSLPDLLDAGPGELIQDRQRVYVAQSALLAEYLGQKLSRQQVLSHTGSPPELLSSLARAMGLTEADLVAGYEAYVLGRIDGASVLHVPAGRERIPAALTDAVAERARAAVAGDAERFLALADSDTRKGQALWLEEARPERYEATVLDMETRGATTRVYLLERITLASGRTVAGVVIQLWYERTGRWLAGPVSSPLQAAGR